MKKVNFNVELEFEDHIYSDNEILEIMVNIKEAIIDQADHVGIAPNDSETFLKSFSVQNNWIDSTIKHDLI